MFLVPKGDNGDFSAATVPKGEKAAGTEMAGGPELTIECFGVCGAAWSPSWTLVLDACSGLL